MSFSLNSKQSIGLNYMHSRQCTPRGSEYPAENSQQANQNRRWRRALGIYTAAPHWLLNVPSGCVCFKICAYTIYSFKVILTALQSLKGGEWKCPNTSFSTNIAESQAGQPLGFMSIFPFKQSRITGGQVAAVPIALFFLAPAVTSSWPCRGRDPGELQQRHQMLFKAPAKLLHLRHPNYFKFKTQLRKACLFCNILLIAPMCTGWLSKQQLYCGASFVINKMTVFM